MMIYVCSLSKVGETVTKTGAERLLSLLAAGTDVTRPASIMPENHLHLVMHDIAVAQEGMTMPGEEHVRALLDFAYRWDRAKPLVVHCYAGVSRSTAAAYITLCALKPERDEAEIAQRMRAASRFAFPNPRIVAIGDEILGRNGRMVAAVKAIGRGELTAENTPFSLGLER